MRRVIALLVGVASSFALCLGLAGGADAAPKPDADNV